ncbi:MAG: beta-mannosidase [Candidatus Fervidibacter sp.]|uniref:beta-mannosidase n=1 Tax=Candidatus Fervidibacter sp. TaxID=3100871 RepID=UPI00404B2429
MERLSLDGIWWLTKFELGEGERQRAFSLDFKLPPERTVLAQVPGVVHLDLTRAGKLPDPFYRLNELAVRWVEELEWWYRRDFEVASEFLKHDAIELVFHGLDTVATIWLNGEGLGEVDNMFIPHRFDVKSLVCEGLNTLVVKFRSPTRVAEGRERDFGTLHSSFYSARPYLRKAQYSFGWDWGPRLPTSGIWRSVELCAYNAACVRNLWAFVTELGNDHSYARVRIEAELNAVKDVDAHVQFILQHRDQQFVSCVPTSLKVGTNFAFSEITVTNPHLWFPNGMGSQPLYQLKCRVEVNEQAVDEKVVRIGLRKVELIQEPDEEGKSFVIRINGFPVFCKGANWIPSDNFLPRVSKERYLDLLKKAAEANMNMLRVWGGGIYEDEVFYDICDELGMMVWQDFMFSCAEYPEDAWFHEQVRHEAETIVKQLRHHACVVLWCGNNENDWFNYMKVWGQRDRFYGETIYAKILPEVCQRLDPSRPYWQSSPFGGVDPNSESEGDRHSWDVWFREDHTGYLRDKGRFISEFGFQAPPNPSTIGTFTELKDRYPNSEVMEHHDKMPDGIQRIYRYMSTHLRVPGDFTEWVNVAQLLQGEALKTGITHWRRRKFKTAGALFWQLNDCWQVVSWSVLDYFGRPKMGYYFAKRVFAPVLVSITPTTPPTIWIVNDLLEPVNGTLVAKVQDVYGRSLWAWNKTVTISPNTSQQVLIVPLPSYFDPHIHLISAELYLREAGGIEPLTYDAVFLAPYKHICLPEARLKAVLDGDGEAFQVSVSSEVFVKCVWLWVEEDPDAIFSDNAFDLLPGMSRKVSLRPSQPTALSELKRRVKVWCYR